MNAKILITADVEILTGLHIGGSNAFSAIGAVDSVVVRDPLTMLPIIPGSSLKGKMRYLLAKYLHEGDLPRQPNEDEIRIRRMFGSSKPIVRARLKYNDCFMQNAEELIKRGVSPTEVKHENVIPRDSRPANPRQIERVVKGSVFCMELFYEIQVSNKNEIFEDFKNIGTAFKLLEFDYLGGHGTRGSGRIRFNNLKAQNAVGNFSDVETLNIKLFETEVQKGR